MELGTLAYWIVGKPLLNASKGEKKEIQYYLDITVPLGTIKFVISGCCYIEVK